jgi:hypothetical protein
MILNVLFILLKFIYFDSSKKKETDLPKSLIEVNFSSNFLVNINAFLLL